MLFFKELKESILDSISVYFEFNCSFTESLLEIKSSYSIILKEPIILLRVGQSPQTE